MKKLILMASAALAFGGIAYAQDTTAPATGTMTPDASQPAATPDMSAQPPAGTTAPDAATAPTDPNAAPAPAPAPTDATGAAPQPGTATGPNGPVSTTPTQGPTDLPMCSKTVTDNCKQGTGSGKSASHHRAMHHHKKK